MIDLYIPLLNSVKSRHYFHFFGKKILIFIEKVIFLMKRVKKRGKNHTIKVDSMLCFNNSLRRYLLRLK